jgi:hypothetical protein
MKKVLIFAAVAEAAKGLALLIFPAVVGQLLLGEQIAGLAIPIARLAGIALVAFGRMANPAQHAALIRPRASSARSSAASWPLP